MAFRNGMSPPIPNGIPPELSGRATPPTGTDRPESDAPEGFDGEQFGALAELDAANGDGVQHRCEYVGTDSVIAPVIAVRCELEAGHSEPHSFTLPTIRPTWSESERVAFLRRAQQEGQR